jgi:hypothetical protein
VFADLYSDLELHSQQYLDQGQSYFRSAADTNNTSFMFKTSGDKSFGKDWQAKWNINTEYSASENWNYLRPQEGFVAWNGFSFGRREITYSNWEERWRQGLFEPRFMDDKLRNTRAGLIGLFFEQQKEFVHWRVGFLPVYLPDMGPHYWVGNGQKFTSLNPWFWPPRPYFLYRNQPSTINYSAYEPPDSQVIFQPGGVAQVEWKPSRSTFSRLSYSYKPMNQMMLGFPVGQQFQTPQNDLFLQLYPRFPYEHIANYPASPVFIAIGASIRPAPGI